MQGRDLHALTGWIPEIIQIAAKDFNFSDLFEQLKNGLNQGHCLITIMSNSGISEEELKRAGLVGNHAYAVLDMREIEVR